MRPVIIGQAPSSASHPGRPLWPELNTTGGRLVEMMGIEAAEYVALFQRVNLLPTYPGRARQRTRRDLFPRHHARIAAQAMQQLLSGREVVLLGREVARAFGHGGSPWMAWRDCQPCGFVYAVIPHPSGSNRWYHKTENTQEIRRFWRTFLKGKI